MKMTLTCSRCGVDVNACTCATISALQRVQAERDELLWALRHLLAYQDQFSDWPMDTSAIIVARALLARIDGAGT